MGRHLAEQIAALLDAHLHNQVHVAAAAVAGFDPVGAGMMLHRRQHGLFQLLVLTVHHQQEGARTTGVRDRTSSTTVTTREPTMATL